MDPFAYSAEFHSRIALLHRGKERWPHYREYLAAHLGGPDSRLVDFTERLVPEIEHHCGSLAGRRVLDLGCGTGATTVALALAGAKVSAFDVDAESVGIARLRLAEHGLAEKVFIWCGRSTDELAPASFDLVLMNGVLEHVPLSVPGLRREVVRAAWRRVSPGGGLYVSDTPNRLWPRDGHSTGLWFLPWAPAGSAWAYRRAVKAGRHSDAPTLARGPRGLEEAGAWGATYWELRRYLEGEKVECVNLEPGHDERLSHTERGSPRRRLIEGLLYNTAVRALRAPLTAFTPGLNHLVLRKGGRGRAR
ncbi:MAG: class I SAM-dependent methyltransferase [Myxococcaceae bacterium]